MIEPRKFLTQLFDAAVAAADPAKALHRHLADPPAGDTIVIGFAKAAASMAAALEHAIDAQWPADARARVRGVVVARKDTNGIHALAADTDGIDGACDAAGAFVAPDRLKRAEAIGLNAAKQQENNDCHPLIDALGDLHRTGPTLTNVNDFRAILVHA